MAQMNIRSLESVKTNRLSVGYVLAHVLLFVLSASLSISLLWQDGFKPTFLYYLLGKGCEAVITQNVPASYQPHLAKNGGNYLQIEFKKVPIRFMLADHSVIDTIVDIDANAANMLTGKTLKDSRIKIRYLWFNPNSVITQKPSIGWISWLYCLRDVLIVSTFLCYVGYGLFYWYRRLAQVKKLFRMS